MFLHAKKAIALCVLTLLSNSVFSKEVFVQYVIDGDTFVYKDNGSLKKVRLYCIDAPEKKQPYGFEAKEGLAKLINHKLVNLDLKGLDKYGREIAVVYSGNNINLGMVDKGLAWVYPAYCPEPTYYNSQNRAVNNSYGLWKNQSPTPPWEFREGSNGYK